MKYSIEDIDYAIDFYILATEELYGQRALKSPIATESAVEATEIALSFQFPPTFRRFIQRCPYFSGISCQTYKPGGIVWDNEWYHEQSENGFLPAFLILFMGGHDGDCYCFDSRIRDKHGECPVVYWDYGSMNSDDISGLKPLHDDFLHHLKFLTGYKIEMGKLRRR